MRSKKILKRNEIMLTLGFMISIYSISLFFSLCYKDFQRYLKINNFNKEHKMILLKNSKPKTMEEFDKYLNNIGIDEYFLTDFNLFLKKDEKLKSITIKSIGGNTKILNNLKINGNLFDEVKNDNEKKVILGNNMKDMTYEENNISYIDLFDEKFKVIGIINDSTYYSNQAYVFLKDIPIYKKEFLEQKILINNLDEEKLEKLTSNNQVKIEKESLPQIKILEQILKENPEIKDIGLFCIFGIINLLLFSIFFANTLKRNLSIMKILGANNKHIALIIFNKMFKMSVFASVLGFLLNFLTIKYLNVTFYNRLNHIDFLNIITTILITFIIVILISISTLLKILKFKISMITR